MWIIILSSNNFKNTCLGVSAGKLKFRTSSPAVFRSSYVFPSSRRWSLPMLFMGQGEVQVQNHLLNSKCMTSDDTLVKTTEENALWRSPCCRLPQNLIARCRQQAMPCAHTPHTGALSCGCCTDFKRQSNICLKLYLQFSGRSLGIVLIY